MVCYPKSLSSKWQSQDQNTSVRPEENRVLGVSFLWEGKEKYLWERISPEPPFPPRLSRASVAALRSSLE